MAHKADVCSNVKMNIVHEPHRWQDASLIEGGAFIPAVSVHRVYERLHRVLDLISNILYALPEETKTLSSSIFWWLKFYTSAASLFPVTFKYPGSKLPSDLGEDDRVEEKQDSTAPPPGMVERQNFLSETRHWHYSPLAEGGEQTSDWFMKHSNDQTWDLLAFRIDHAEIIWAQLSYQLTNFL